MGGGKATLLLVEDESGIRELTSELLASWGYEVLVARNGVEALDISGKHRGTIHLMVTDVVMPHMNGRDLAERMKQMRPAMKVIYMSGYTDNLVLQGGMLEEGSDFIQKPFNAETLAKRVRASERRSPRSGPPREQCLHDRHLGGGPARARAGDQRPEAVRRAGLAGLVVPVPAGPEQHHHARRDRAVAPLVVLQQLRPDGRADPGTSTVEVRRHVDHRGRAGELRERHLVDRDPPQLPRVRQPGPRRGDEVRGASRWVPVCSSISIQRVW